MMASANPTETDHRRAVRPVGLWLLVLLLAALVTSLVATAQPKFPALTGRIVDEAGLLSSADRALLEADLKALEAKSSDQLVVYTTKSLQGYPIEDFGYQLGRAWKIGQVGGNNGIVLIVAPGDRKVRIEVGRGLEGQMTDLMSKLIIDNAILPAFRRGDFAGGVKAGVRDIVSVLTGDAEAVKDRARYGQKRSGQDTDWVGMAFMALFLLIFVSVFFANARAAQNQPATVAGRRRAGGRRVVVVPGGWGGSGTWGSSGSSGSSSSGDSGGGFSGGGGDFGGGGSSGSW